MNRYLWKWAGVLLLAIAIAAVGCLVWLRWKRDAPRRRALATVSRFNEALTSGADENLLAAVVAPSVLTSRTPQEQAEFLRKALRDEVSAEGLAALKRIGKFGPLREVFPDEADKWARQAGVSVSDCVAYRAERNGIRAELVLVSEQGNHRVVRCNNIAQLANKGSVE
jgi:hypothetical protein